MVAYQPKKEKKRKNLSEQLQQSKIWRKEKKINQLVILQKSYKIKSLLKPEEKRFYSTSSVGVTLPAFLPGPLINQKNKYNQKYKGEIENQFLQTRQIKSSEPWNVFYSFLWVWLNQLFCHVHLSTRRKN